ncbi:MAG: cell division protein FtsL [Oligoflexia bacterium]|nr:cell division protein FtsL [Oligoflexia bacterium]
MKKANSGTGSTNFRILVFAFSITLVTLFFVWTRLQNIRLKLEKTELKRKEQEAQLEYNRLNYEWQRLVSPKRLEALGKEKFHLNRPKPNQVVFLKVKE